MNRLLFFGASALTAALFAATPSIAWAQAQAFPNKVVKIVVPYTPGAVTDTAGRLVGQHLSEIWGQPVIVENRPGAGTTIGAEYVAKSAPDGYTLLFADNGTYAISPHLFTKLNYNALTDFAPITVVFRSTLVFALSNAVPAKDFKEFLAYVKANPGKIVYGSWGSGSNPHLAIEQLKRMAGLDMVHVPYKGGAPALADLMGGKRLPVRPDVPTVIESGVPGYTMISWFAMAAAAGTPAPVLDKIRADIVKVLQDPRADGFAEKYLKPQALQPGGDSREEFASLYKAEYERWGRLVKSVGAKLD
ncbi:MAG: tripartite tricarboxylate transporter substrate binding protein [Betaproteobacteria bacterium]|nr:tripartite tricarboxylate transporter substrate binding protein [Betaproteobacteria bacterium]